jgi:hypothetical protein
LKLNPRDDLKPEGLKGISNQQIEYHFETHYKGYVNKLNEVWDKLQTADRSKANQNYSDYRALKVEESFNLYSIQATTHPCGPLLIVNGHIAQKLDINSGYGAFGPGWRANATIGRALRNTGSNTAQFYTDTGVSLGLAQVFLTKFTLTAQAAYARYDYNLPADPSEKQNNYLGNLGVTIRYGIG